MFTPHSMNEAATSQSLSRVKRMSDDGKHFSRVLAPWFQGLNEYLHPLSLDPVTPDAHLHADNQYMWTWVVTVRTPIVGMPPVAEVVVRLFANAVANPAMTVAFNPNARRTAWNETGVWRKVEEYVDLTLGSLYRTAHCSRIYTVLDDSEDAGA